MTSPTQFKAGPLYFFDQPTRRRRTKGTRGGVLEAAQPEDAVLRSRGNDNEGDEEDESLPGETREPDTSSTSTKDLDPVDAYKRAAPRLLHELSGLLCQHEWAAEGRLPNGVANIVSHTWQDLTAGAARPKCPLNPDQTSRLVPPSDVKEAGRRNSCVAGSSDSERQPQVSTNAPVRKRKQKSKIGPSILLDQPSRPTFQNPTTPSISISSNSSKSSGWIVEFKQPSYDAPQQISLCQWVVERLHTARNPEKLQTAKYNQNRPLIMRHYGCTKSKPKDRRARRNAWPDTLVNGIPQIPEVKQEDPAQQKLHYMINDGSSFIYYFSGCVAVCQSHSGLPSGGFDTNVFSDSQCPTILATITAFGHGMVTDPLSSTITAVWDQDGGFMCDHVGNTTKEWSWKTDHMLRGKIDIQLSDLISVRIFSGTSAMLSFRCNDDCVQLPLVAMSNFNQPKEMLCLQTDGKYISDAAQDLQLVREKKSPVCLENKRNLTLTPVFQMVKEVDWLEEPLAQWRRGVHVGRELKRLQQRIRNIVDDWLAYYRVAIGIRCLDTKRMPDAPLRTRLRREVQSATLPSLNPPERADVKPVQPEEGRADLKTLHRHLATSAEKPLDSSVIKRLPRAPKKHVKEESCVTQIGPLQIHGNIQPESVIIPRSLESQTTTVSRCPAPPSFTPSVPLTLCPVLLRAALLGEGGRRRCYCSATQMPVVTDLEYDAFVMGQPPHSQQILVVCVTLMRQSVNTQGVPERDTLEQLYRKRNKHRTMPCTQCQMDSFRLVKYEISTVEHGCGAENILLQQRHSAAPGMVLMYIRGNLLFVGYIFSAHSCSVRDLHKQISRTRGDYRLGLSLPPDYRFSDIVNTSTDTDVTDTQDATLAGGDEVTLPASVENKKASERKHSKVPKASHKRQRPFCIKLNKNPGFPHVPVITH